MIRLFLIHLGINFLWVSPLVIYLLGYGLAQALN